ncbi:hypothetical protein [Nocardia wallacei]|uniref:hypothetical protein n=1 Tax=Nocardia wallacei TaxID=480035 RepID=UPI00245601BC|nr:hypothetical protein [Nocardia wallacei]
MRQRRDRRPGHRSVLFDLTRQEMASCHPFTAAVIALFHRRFNALITHDLAALRRFPADTHHTWHQQTKTSCPHAC